MTEKTFTGLGLVEPLTRALAAENYTIPTPIQARAIPALLDGRDLLGMAQTGTGKTAAFTLPLLQHLTGNRRPPGGRACRALILAPTRELAMQINEMIGTYSRYLPVRHTVITGGVNQNRQIKAMRHGVDILVATPGRLLDLINQRHVALHSAKTLILDEADRMFDMGFIRDIRKLVALLPRDRQTMLFSATMPAEIEKLVREVLRDPVRIEIMPETKTVERVEQTVYHVPGPAKRSLLRDLMADPALSRVIVFTRTKHGANRLAGQLLKDGVNADAIHGNKSQGARQRALENFREGTARVLVATDIAARGIDVDGVTHVINFDLPMEAESYIHRIGRTARAGASGLAISFCDPAERKYLRDIERLIKRPITPANSVEEAGEEPRESTRRNYRGPKQGRPNGGGDGQPGRRKFRRSRNRRKVA